MTMTAASVPAVSAIAAATPAASPVAPAAPAAAAGGESSAASVEPLHRVGGRIRAKWDPAPLPTTAPAATPGETVAAPATAAPAAAPVVEAPKVEGQNPAETAKPAESGDSESWDQILADINKTRRELNAERKRLKQKGDEHTKAAEQAARLAKAEALFADGKFAEAIRTVKPDANLDELSLSLIQSEDTADQPLTAADVERIAKEKIEAERQAEAERKRTEGEAALSRQEVNYLTVCQQELDANPAEYPNLKHYEPKPGEFREFAMAYVGEHGHAPATTETLKHFERVATAAKVSELVRAGRVAEAVALMSAVGKAPAASPAPAASAAPTVPPVGTTVAGSTVMDTRGQPAPAPSGERKSLAQLRAETRALIEKDNAAAAAS